MFRTISPSIARIFSLYTQQWYILYRFADSLLTGAYAPARKLSANLYDIYRCCVYSEILLTMDRETVRNMQIFISRINLSNQCVQFVLLQKFITMHGQINVKLKFTSEVSVFVFQRIFPKIFSTLIYVFLYKQCLSFQNSFGVLSRLCQGKVYKDFFISVVLADNRIFCHAKKFVLQVEWFNVT